jgi:S-layer homology domain.
VYNNNIFKGTSENTFEPDTLMDRSMFVTVLGRVANINTDEYNNKGNNFTDVKDNEWYTPYINWATEIGLIYGYGGGLFGTEDYVTHEQVNLIIERFMNYLDISDYNIAKDKFNSTSNAKRWEVATILFELNSFIN